MIKSLFFFSFFIYNKMQFKKKGLEKLENVEVCVFTVKLRLKGMWF